MMQPPSESGTGLGLIRPANQQAVADIRGIRQRSIPTGTDRGRLLPVSLKEKVMAVRRIVLGAAAAMLAFGSALAPIGAQAAAIDGKFNAALERLLMGMEDGPVAQMTKQEKKELVACVRSVFGKIPEAKKEYIATSSSQAELRARFDEVGLENRAALKQQVRDECA